MILDQFKLTNRNALIIGGNRGLGIEMAKALAEAGASVAVAARDADRNAEAVSILEPLGAGKTMSVVCDVLEEDKVNQAVQSVNEELGSIDILINSEKVDALSLIVHKSRALTIGRKLVNGMKEVIPRQNFDIAIQAAIGSQIISRATTKAYRKDVTAKLYGGDVTRKMKLLKKQKIGKKRMKQVGKVELPQEAFMAVLKIDTND